MGRAWHGIRDHVFDFARHNFHPDFSESQKSSFMDLIDKGGAEGIQSALLKVTGAEEFQQKATSSIDSEAMNDIITTNSAISNPYMSALSEEAAQQAISESSEDTMQELSTEASSTMAEALLPIQHMVDAVLESALEVPSEGEGARNMVHFIISTVGEAHIRQRCLTMTEGFVEYLDVAKVWIIANACLHLAHKVLEETEAQELDRDWLCAIIEFVREGVMPVEKTPGRTGEVAGWRMLYWLEEACQCRSAWGAAREDVGVWTLRNQVQWEESCVLMGGQSRTWNLS